MERTSRYRARDLDASAHGLLLAFALAACHPAAPIPSAPAPAPAAASATSEPVSVAAVETSTPAATAAPAPAETSHPAGPGRVACGATSCSAATEVCCADPGNKQYACAPRAETPSPILFEGPGGAVDLAPQHCATARGEMAYPELWYCDGSDDCPANEACCQTSLRLTFCVHDRGGARSACDLGEACSAGSCRAKGARCEEGLCRKERPALACGKSICGKDAPLCRVEGNAQRCIARGSGERDSSLASVLECRGPADCLAGQRCCVGSSGTETHCAGSCGDGDTPTCLSSADCRGVSVPFVEGESASAPLCKAAASLGVKRCVTGW
jgi:hypothetical protein